MDTILNNRMRQLLLLGIAYIAAGMHLHHWHGKFICDKKHTNYNTETSMFAFIDHL